MDVSELEYIDQNDVLMQAKRKLGSIETTMAIIHKEFHGTTQANMLIELNCVIPFSDLVRAARHIFDKYEILRCGICEIEFALWFCESSDFDQISITHKTIESAAEFGDLWSEEIDKPLISANALWRVVLVDEKGVDKSKILLTSHHSMIDNDGFKALATILLLHLDKVISGEAVESIEYKISKPIDVYLRDKEPKQHIPSPHQPIAYKNICPLEKRKTGVVSEHLEIDQYERLQNVCEKEKIRVHSVLSAAYGMAAYLGGFSQSLVPVKTAVSLKIFKELRKTNENILGCFISVADTPIDVSSEDIKIIALAYEKQLSSYMRSNCFNKIKPNISALRTMMDTLRNSNVFLQGFAISNLGLVDMPTEYKNFHAENFIGTVNRLAGNFAVALQIDVFKGEMRFRFGYPNPLWDEESVKKISSTFINLLTDFYSEDIQ